MPTGSRGGSGGRAVAGAGPSAPRLGRGRGGAILACLLLAAGAASAYDLHRTEARTLVVYATAALADPLEKAILPAFTAQTGIHAVAVYLSAGEEYNRVLLSRDRPEADLFLHASPLFLQQGNDAGLFDAFAAPPQLSGAAAANLTGPSPQDAGAGVLWAAFAWSPLVEVYAPSLPAPPDLATAQVRFGLPHPLLSNNGAYAAILFQGTDPAAGRRAVSRTVVQPTNGRATIGGVADGSFDVTLGYEAVASLYQRQGAKVAYGVPVVDGSRVTTPVLFCAGLVRHRPHLGAEQLLSFLLDPATQATLAQYGFRPVVGNATPAGALDLSGARTVRYPWSQWQALESVLPSYEVKA